MKHGFRVLLVIMAVVHRQGKWDEKLLEKRAIKVNGTHSTFVVSSASSCFRVVPDIVKEQVLAVLVRLPRLLEAR